MFPDLIIENKYQKALDTIRKYSYLNEAVQDEMRKEFDEAVETLQKLINIVKEIK